MKLKVIAFIASLAASMGLSHAGSGVFGFGIELDGTGALATNSGTVTLYALDNSGTTRLEPSGSSAVISTAWTGASNQASPSFNLGTFVYGTNSLTLEGGSILTFKNGTSDVTAAALNYELYKVGTTPGSFTAVNLPFNQDNVAGNTGDQRWASESGTTNLLSGLGVGTYELVVYGSTASSDGGAFESNGGANFGATFTVVPEPSTYAMMFAGLGALVAFQRLRRNSVS